MHGRITSFGVVVVAAIAWTMAGRGADKNRDWPAYAGDKGSTKYSPLDQINKDTVKNLVPVWNYSFNDDRSEESQPLVYQGVIYVTSHNATMAVDAKTGKQIWKTKVEYPAETPRIVCCGIINRGAALYDGKVFRTTLDAKLQAAAETRRECRSALGR